MKNVKALLLIAAILLSVLLIACNNRSEAPADTSASEITTADATEPAETQAEESTAEETTAAVTAIFGSVSPAEGEEILLIDSKLQEWCLNYKQNSLLFSSEEMKNKLKNSYCTSVKLKWTCDREVSGYTVKLWIKPESVKTYDTASPEVSLIDLFINETYSWQITAHTEEGDADSPVYTFKTYGEIRQVQLKNVDNMRDIGVYTTSFGKMKQGVVYRSARLDSITKASKRDALNIYGIKTELDLRGMTEAGNPTGSFLGSDVNYVCVAALQYGDIFKQPEVMGQELTVFTDPANFPVVFHCAGGRDRTGALAAILEMLCGVSEIELYRDYELTFIIPNTNMGAVPNEAAKSYIVSYFTPFLEQLKNRYGTDDLSICAEKLCLECGLTVDQINAIRNNLLEEGWNKREVSPILEIQEFHLIEDQDDPVKFYDAETIMAFTKTNHSSNLGECSLGDGYVTISAAADGETNIYMTRIPMQAAPYLLIKCRSTASSRALEFFIATNGNAAKGTSRTDAVYTNDGTWNYVIVDLTAAAEFDGISCEHLRIDYLNHVNAGESIDVGYVGLFTSAEAAQRYADANP